MKNLIFNLFRKRKRKKIIKYSLKHIGGDEYLYSDYYNDNSITEYYVYTDNDWGIKWYDKQNCKRCYSSFEDLLERLHRILKRRNIDIIEEYVE